MTMYPLSKPLLFCALFAVSGAACAQARQPTAEQKQALQERLRSADSNGDGLIDKAEADAKLPRIAKNFDRLDSDRDGKLSPEELKAMAAKFADRRR